VLSSSRSFGPADLGLSGMRKFFATHRCGPTCEALGLKAAEDFELIASVPSERGAASVLSELLDEEEFEDSKSQLDNTASLCSGVSATNGGDSKEWAMI